MFTLRFSGTTTRRIACLPLLLAVLIGGSHLAWAAEGDWSHVTEPVRFLRLVEQLDGEPEALATAILRCRPVDGSHSGPIVDLVSAIHVAEPEFYSQLNREFPWYDAVLYELVAPEGTRVPKGGARTGSNPVSFFQHGLTDLLELQFQLEGIDYTPANFIHADMSPEQFARSMKDRGENFSDLFFRMMGYTMARQNETSGKSSDARLLMALFAGNRAMALRRIMAEQFETMQGAMNALDGPEGSTLIAERNKVALDVLRRELADGKRKVAIFYGAGHMTDMLTRLRNEFGLVPVEIRWLTAWKLQ